MRNIKIALISNGRELNNDGELADSWCAPSQFIIEGNIDNPDIHKMDRAPKFMKFVFDSKIVSGMFALAEMSSFVNGTAKAKFESIGNVEVVHK